MVTACAAVGCAAGYTLHSAGLSKLHAAAMATVLGRDKGVMGYRDDSKRAESVCNTVNKHLQS